MSDTARAWFIFTAVMALFGLIGWAIGKPKDRGDTGIILGLVLGPIGLVLVALLSPTEDERHRRASKWTATLPSTPPGANAAGSVMPQPRDGRVPCPWCAERIMPGAKVCRYCSRELPASPDR